MKTKVFGIGFHKTGTKSLAEALRLLGYRVTGPNWTDHEDIAATALDLAVAHAAHFDAFQDNPWPILYRELDARFPGSRFILTVRSAESWIGSVTAHFGDRRKPMREWIYGEDAGSPAGNQAIYLARYRRHNAEVLEYFARRRGDLLVLDFEAGDGWEKLCGFLGCEVPPVDFPRVNRADAPMDQRRRQSPSDC